MPLVFFSYARANGGPPLERFYRDLVARLSDGTGLSADEIAFRDTSSIELGERWSDELAIAISRSRVLVSLCSPHYFNSPWCGREFAIFQQRLEAFAAEKGLPGPPPLILPVVWIAEKKGGRCFPAKVKTLQWTEEFGADYLAKGLWYIANLNKFNDTYEEIVSRIADRIMAVSADHALPELGEPITFESVGSAFEDRAADEPPAPPRRGPGHVQFVLVAARRDELRDVRQRTDAYGDASGDWRPFLPPKESRIGPLLQGTAAEEDFTSEVVQAEGDLVEHLARARGNNNLVLVVVDPWTLRIQEYSDRLHEYDEHNFLNSAVLVPWNQDDDETKAQKDTLETAIRATFPNRAIAPDPRWFRIGLDSPDALRQGLRQALVDVKKRILEQAEVARKVASARVFIKPVISAVRTP